MFLKTSQISKFMNEFTLVKGHSSAYFVISHSPPVATDENTIDATRRQCSIDATKRDVTRAFIGIFNYRSIANKVTVLTFQLKKAAAVVVKNILTSP